MKEIVAKFMCERESWSMPSIDCIQVDVLTNTNERSMWARKTLGTAHFPFGSNLKAETIFGVSQLWKRLF